MEASSSSLSIPLLYFGRDRFMRKWMEEENTLLLFSTLPVAQTDREEEGKEPNASVSPAQFLKKSFFSFRKKISFSSYNPIRHFFFLLPIPKGERMKEKERGREWKTHFFSSSPLPQPELDAVPLFLLPFNSSTFPYPATVKVSVSRKKRLFFHLVCQSHITLFPFVSKFANWDISSREKKSAKRYKLARICQDRQFRRQKTQRKQKKNIVRPPIIKKMGYPNLFPLVLSVSSYTQSKQRRF